MKEYLEKVANSFQWSMGVSEHLVSLSANARKSLQDLRKRRDAFWNKEEGLVTKAAKEQEHAAQVAEQAAQEKKEAADRARLLMLDEKERLKEMMVKAQEERK